ncbi:MAG: endolytic transglycosylase MltG [Coriobacteriales bacterium]|jgi:UPF0755 protein|nr:endolytic transglycosylase MltG [Coriobacteriales bacterium]
MPVYRGKHLGGAHNTQDKRRGDAPENLTEPAHPIFEHREVHDSAADHFGSSAPINPTQAVDAENYISVAQLATRERPRHRVGKTVGILVLIGLGLALLAGGVLFAYHQFLAPVSDGVPGQQVQVRVLEGASTAQIASILKQASVISDERAFTAAVRAAGAEALLKPGVYDLLTLMDTELLIQSLVGGPPLLGTRLTIAEGLTVEQTAQVVQDVCGIANTAFLDRAYAADEYVPDYPFLEGVYNNSLEGFLYPKTYEVPAGADADYVIRLLLNQFALETNVLDLTYATERNLTLFDVVCLASLIERETGAAKERELVASVIYNRLRLGMRLQIDATVIYALGPGYDGHPLLNGDLEVDSSYNTYRVDQLPAGPICSPRIESLQAAAHPAQTNYLYYVLTDTQGFHTFCATSEEFEAAKIVYQEVFNIAG